MKHQNAVPRAVPRILAVVAAAAALTLGASWATAGPRPFPPPSPERIISHLGEELDLTEEQASLLAHVIEESVDRHREIAKKYDKQERGMRRAAREERQAVEGDVEAQLASILTAEQMEEYLQLKDERRSRRGEGARRGGRGEHRGGRGAGRGEGGPSPDRMIMHLSEQLELTADQEERLLPIFEESFEQRRELFESVRSEKRGERNSVRGQMEEITADMEAKVAGVLTAEQMDEFTELREERQSRRERGGHFRGRHRF